MCRRLIIACCMTASYLLCINSSIADFIAINLPEVVQEKIAKIQLYVNQELAENNIPQLTMIKPPRIDLSIELSEEQLGEIKKIATSLSPIDLTEEFNKGSLGTFIGSVYYNFGGFPYQQFNDQLKGDPVFKLNSIRLNSFPASGLTTDAIRIISNIKLQDKKFKLKKKEFIVDVIYRYDIAHSVIDQYKFQSRTSIKPELTSLSNALGALHKNLRAMVNQLQTIATKSK